jgi:hypothetical protein
MNWLRPFRQGRDSTRHICARRPLVEGLEGRLLLTGLQGNHGTFQGIIGRDIDTSGVAEVQKVRDAAVTVRGTSNGVTEGILKQGGHLGGSVTPDIIAIL